MAAKASLYRVTDRISVDTLRRCDRLAQWRDNGKSMMLLCYDCCYRASDVLTAKVHKATRPAESMTIESESIDLKVDPSVEKVGTVYGVN